MVLCVYDTSLWGRQYNMRVDALPAVPFDQFVETAIDAVARAQQVEEVMDVFVYIGIFQVRFPRSLPNSYLALLWTTKVILHHRRYSLKASGFCFLLF